MDEKENTTRVLKKIAIGLSIDCRLRGREGGVSEGGLLQ